MSTCLQPGAAEKLAALLRPTDSVVAVSALAPVKSTRMLADNLRMALAMVEALAKAPVAHLVNISSDAIYADGPLPLTEASPAAPGSLHGAMHLARELAFRTEVQGPAGASAADPHLRRVRPPQRLRPQSLPAAGGRGQGHRAVRRGRGAPRPRLHRRCGRDRRSRPPMQERRRAQHRHRRGAFLPPDRRAGSRAIGQTAPPSRARRARAPCRTAATARSTSPPAARRSRTSSTRPCPEGMRISAAA